MIPYYGKHYYKQFIRGKPIRYGFKNWAMCASSGNMTAFSLYTGKSSDKKDFGLGGDIVLTLVELGKLPAQSGIKIYFRQFFHIVVIDETSTRIRLLCDWHNKG